MPNMVTKVKTDHYESKIWRLGLSIDGFSAVLDKNGNEIPFKWVSTHGFSKGLTPTMNTIASTVADVDMRIKDESQKFSLKGDLVEHIWQNLADK